MFELTLIANTFCSVFLAGVIWFVQIVQYPRFRKISPFDFREFHRFHVIRIGLVVIPPMMVKLGTSIWLTVEFERFWIINATGLGLIICIWFSTFSVQLPIHRNLQQGAVDKISKLIRFARFRRQPKLF